jgi:circadian clock protein KaiB
MSKASSFKFRLYVAGEAPNSTQARHNLTSLCRQYLPDRHEIEIVDVTREPQRALADGVLLTPQLLRVYPTPVRKVVGNLSQLQPLLQTLEIPP